MNPEFWAERWRSGRIGFHEGQTNAALERNLGALALTSGDTVFVPMCGKSRDMIWLRREGYRVLGVEIIEQAVIEFFEENEIPFERRVERSFTRYSGEGIDLLCGDVFALSRGQLQASRAVYDRAALIALPPEARRRYARHLSGSLPAGWRMLLVTIDYDQGPHSGPPFAVPADEVRMLYGSVASIERLERKEAIERSASLKAKGVTELWEEVWMLTSAM